MILKFSLHKVFDISFTLTSLLSSALLVSLLILSSCNAIEEFSHMTILEIKSVNPSSQRINHDSLNHVSITFSQAMNRSRTEYSFTLKKNSSPVNGKFSWEKNTLIFSPFNGFSRNTLYIIEISTGAEDRYGNSLSEKFLSSFSTSTEEEIPFFISSIPKEDEIITEELLPLTLIFSEPVASDSVYSSFSIMPQVKGHISLSNGERNIVFTPVEKYTEGTDYTITVTEDLKDLSGNQISEILNIFFTMKKDEKPELLWLGDLSGAEYENTENLIINSSVEKNTKIRLVYNREVNAIIEKSPFKIKPDIEYNVLWNTELTEAVVSFENYLEYNEIYEITADEKTYRLLINGSASLPPELNKITFCNDSSIPTFEELTLNKGIVFLTSDSAFFDLYFTLAQGASIYDSEIFSSIDFKCVSGDLLIKPIRILNPAAGPPVPAPPPSENNYIIRIECIVSAGTVVSPFRIDINPEFKDSLSNKIPEEISIQVISL